MTRFVLWPILGTLLTVTVTFKAHALGSIIAEPSRQGSKLSFGILPYNEYREGEI